MTHTFAHWLDSGRTIVIDGALGTALEARGLDLGHQLWSAELLRQRPEILAEVHAEYVRAGARIISTASYQATPVGFASAGISEVEARDLIRTSVQIAAEAAAGAVGGTGTAGAEGAAAVLVAGSVGPYGAALGDGSEYTGAYSLDRKDFAAFHRPRIEALVDAGADLLAIETQPHVAEIEVLAELADEYDIPAWLSVTLSTDGHLGEGGADGTGAEGSGAGLGTGRNRADAGKYPAGANGGPNVTLADGTPLTRLAEVVSAHASIRALGVNCVFPRLVSPALRILRSATDLPLIAYPNSGEIYDAATMQWHTEADAEGTTMSADTTEAEAGTATFPLEEWRELGARLIGGCCRTTPTDIAAIADRLRRPTHPLSRTTAR